MTEMPISLSSRIALQPVKTIKNKGFTRSAEQIVVSHEPIVFLAEIVDKLVEGLFSVQTVQLSSALYFRLITAALICIILTLHHCDQLSDPTTHKSRYNTLVSVSPHTLRDTKHHCVQL